jgi:hypothetical protein
MIRVKKDKSIQNWGIEKKWLIFKGLRRTSFDFFKSYIIIVVVDYCMPIDKLMSC